MAATENEQLVRGLVERWNAGDRDSILEVVDPDTELHSRLGSLRGAPYRGEEGFREWLADIDEQFRSFEIVIEKLYEVEPGLVVASGRVDFRGRSSDLPWKQETYWVLNIDGGRLRRFAIHTDRDDALSDAGIDDL